MPIKSKPGRVEFSPIDQIISVSTPDSSSSDSESEELNRAMMKGLALDDVRDETDRTPSLSSKPPSHKGSPSRESPILPPTPRLKARELPPDEDSHGSRRGASSSTNSGHRSMVPRISALHVSNADDSLSLILVTRLTSGDSYGWDLTTDPFTRGTRVAKMLAENGHLPAAFSAYSQEHYKGELRIKHKAISSALGVRPLEGAECVTIRDVCGALYTFMQKRVRNDDLAAEDAQRQSEILQAAMMRTGSTRPEVRRVDFLLGNVVFSGLCLGKDGKTAVLLTSSKISTRRAA